jgi:hypothetical protein
MKFNQKNDLNHKLKYGIVKKFTLLNKSIRQDSMKNIFYFIFLFILTGCGGTHGKIKSYYFEHSNSTDELISIVDRFLQNNPTYNSYVDAVTGWIYIQIPHNKDRFGFSIGRDSEITLISAGEKGNNAVWEKRLGYFEKKRLIKSFEKNFIEKLKGIKPRPLNLLREPFLLTMNIHADTTTWPHYVIKYDTLVRYPLPSEITELGFDYFLDLITDYSNYIKDSIFINQYYHAFRINADYTGFVRDTTILINAYYRVIGQQRSFNPILIKKAGKNI